MQNVLRRSKVVHSAETWDSFKNKLTNKRINEHKSVKSTDFRSSPVCFRLQKRREERTSFVKSEFFKEGTAYLYPPPLYKNKETYEK